MAEDPFAELLPEGCISLGFVACIKALDAEGDVTLHQVRSGDLAAWEAAGMLLSTLDDLRDYLRGLGREVDAAGD